MRSLRGDGMKLGDILDGCNNIYVREFEPWGDGVIFVGGCFYGDNTIIQIDGRQYSMNMELAAVEWDDDTLMIMR